MSTLGYSVQNVLNVLGTPSAKVTLTSGYSDNRSSTINFGNYAQLLLEGIYTPGAGGTGNKASIIIETSPDGINWVQDNAQSTSSGTTTLAENTYVTAAGTASTAMSVKIYAPQADLFLRVSAKEVSVGGSAGTLWLSATLSGI